jgi:hypothetical protein
MQDEKKHENLVIAEGCFALVQLLKKCLDKAIAKIPEAERTTLHKTLSVIVNLSHHHEESIAVAAIGGVEAVVKVMETFPMCETLQVECCALLGLESSNQLDIDNIIEAGAIDILLAVVNNNLDPDGVCESVCGALCNIVKGSKENTGLPIAFGGVTTVAEVRTSDSNEVQTQLVRLAALVTMLLELIVTEFGACGES